MAQGWQVQGLPTPKILGLPCMLVLLLSTECLEGLWTPKSHTHLFHKRCQGKQKWKVDTNNKMDNPRFVDEETILLVQDEDYDNYNTLNTSMVDETSFTEPETTEATLTPRLRQKVKQDKITALYRHLNVTGDPGLANINRFMIKKKIKNRQL